jgi:hypothetical protein
MSFKKYFQGHQHVFFEVKGVVTSALKVLLGVFHLLD